MYGDVWLELLQRRLSAAPPLVNQALELRRVILKREATHDWYFHESLGLNHTDPAPVGSPCFCTFEPS